ncbi:MAG: FHA domain-containing protein [Planctomycetota bacterium]
MQFLNLVHTRADGELDTYYLKAGRCYHVGRGSVSEIRILDMRMSRKHARIECRDDAWWVADAGSTNGVRLNDMRIDDSQQLKAGDRLHIGETDMLVDLITDHLTAPAPIVTPEFRRDTVESGGGDEVPVQEAIFVSLLGHRVGPLDRQEAREFKKKELAGQLTHDDIRHLVNE